MRRIVIAVIRQLHGAMILTGVLSGIALILGFFGLSAQVYFLYGLLVLIPYLVSALAEEKISGIGLFLLIRIASVIPVVIFAPDLASKIVFFGLSVIIVIIRIAGRLRDAGTILNSPHFATVLLFAVLYIIGTAVNQPFLMNVNYYLAFAYILAVLVYMNFTNLEGYLEVNRDVANVPKRTIGRTNNLMLLGYLALTVVLMLVVPLFGLDRAIRALWQGILALIRLITSRGGDTEAAESSIAEETMAASAPQDGMFAEDTPTPLWLEAFYHALTVMITFIVGAAIIIGLIYAVYRLVKAFYRPAKENGDVEEFINDTDDRESVSGADGIFGRVREFFDPSPNSVIRRAYRRRIRKEKKDIQETMTPSEIEDAAGLPAGDERRVYHELYEKARYSKAGCSTEDVQTLKKA